MKTYEIYGSSPGTPPTAHERRRKAHRIALQLQQVLDVELLAREDGEPRGLYRHRAVGENSIQEVFVLNNSANDGDPPYPEVEHQVVVRLNEPAAMPPPPATLEALGLTLLRRRRREYSAPRPVSAEPVLELYGAPADAASVVGLLSPLLGMAFDGNEHAATGGDSHYYDESERFGTILIFDNMPKPHDDIPFPAHSDSRAVVIAVNPTDDAELRRLLLGHGFALLKTTESKADE